MYVLLQNLFKITVHCKPFFSNYKKHTSIYVQIVLLWTFRVVKKSKTIRLCTFVDENIYYTKIKIQFIKTCCNPEEIGRKIWLAGGWSSFTPTSTREPRTWTPLWKPYRKTIPPHPFFPNPHSYITGGGGGFMIHPYGGGWIISFFFYLCLICLRCQ